MGHLHPKVIAELELEKFGLDRIEVPDVIYPLYDDDCIVFTKDPKKNREQIARFSKKDAEVYPQFFESLFESIWDGHGFSGFQVEVDGGNFGGGG